MPTPNQSSVFPTFLQYWKNLIQPTRRVVPIVNRPAVKSTSKSNRKAESSHCQLEGELSISSNGSYGIDGKDFAIDAHTLVFGELKVGSKAKVICTVEGGKRRAVKIIIS